MVTSELSESMRNLLARRQAELDTGARSVGWKVGLSAPALQAALGLDGPLVGYLTDATVLDVGAPVDLSGWDHPALEVEVAVRVGPDGGVAALAPALELVDLNVPFDTLGPIIEGNICHRHVIFGPEVDRTDPGRVEVSAVDAQGRVSTGELTESPAATVRVVREFLARHGAVLWPGDRIIAGTLIAPLPVAAGDRVAVSFGPLGSLDVAFSGAGRVPPD
jgi:2-keto-4-pentenoate hydratase